MVCSLSAPPSLSHIYSWGNLIHFHSSLPPPPTHNFQMFFSSQISLKFQSHIFHCLGCPISVTFQNQCPTAVSPWWMSSPFTHSRNPEAWDPSGPPYLPHAVPSIPSPKYLLHSSPLLSALVVLALTISILSWQVPSPFILYTVVPGALLKPFCGPPRPWTEDQHPSCSPEGPSLSSAC